MPDTAHVRARGAFMKRSIPLLSVLFLALSAPLLAQDAPPPEHAARELDRSRRCVPVLARLQALNAELEPLARRADRLRALDAAVALEDSLRVAPLDSADPVEQAVRQWFVDDEELARQYVEAGSDALLSQRTERRERLRERLLQALGEVGDQAQGHIAAAGDLQTASAECEDAILIRSAVLEACTTASGPVCEDARATEPQGRFAFVDAADDLWDVEQFRPWTDPTSLGVAPDGSLAGARTAALSRRGNLLLVLNLEPLIRPRSALTAEEAAEFDAHLDSLGIAFDGTDWVMAPALGVHLNVTAPLGGETHYFLHFGGLSDPANEVIWTSPATSGQPITGVFRAGGGVLNRLAAGEEVSLTAVRIPEGENEAEAVFTLGLTQVGQARAVTAVLSYISSGQLSKDLAALVPPASTGR